MSDPVPEDVVQHIRDALFAGRKIEAIKLYREHSGLGLKESKDFIERLERELREREPDRFTVPPGRGGCAAVAAVFFMAGLALLA
jgi:hypothetical protein